MRCQVVAKLGDTRALNACCYERVESDKGYQPLKRSNLGESPRGSEKKERKKTRVSFELSEEKFVDRKRDERARRIARTL